MRHAITALLMLAAASCTSDPDLPGPYGERADELRPWCGVDTTGEGQITLVYDAQGRLVERNIVGMGGEEQDIVFTYEGPRLIGAVSTGFAFKGAAGSAAEHEYEYDQIDRLKTHTIYWTEPVEGRQEGTRITYAYDKDDERAVSRVSETFVVGEDPLVYTHLGTMTFSYDKNDDALDVFVSTEVEEQRHFVSYSRSSRAGTTIWPHEQLPGITNVRLKDNRWNYAYGKQRSPLLEAVHSADGVFGVRYLCE